MYGSRPRRSFDAMTPLAELKKTHRATWASGDYPAVAERIDEVPPRDLLDRIAVRPGEDVLDVATGTGNVALRAAAAGAKRGGARPHPRAVRHRVAAHGRMGRGRRLIIFSCPIYEIAH